MSNEWFINGVKAGPDKQPIVAFGEITLAQAEVGRKIKCKVLSGGNVWNESEKGLASIEGFTTYGCEATPECPGAFATAEEPLMGEKEGESRERQRRLPWSGELVEKANAEGTEERRLKIRGITLTLILPCESREVAREIKYDGYLEPTVENGLGNGLSPSFAAYMNEEQDLMRFCLCEIIPTETLFVSGRMTTIGTHEELVTAE